MAKKRALISVSDKTGVVEFARGLEKLGYEIISTGGTSTAIREAGIAVLDVSDITGFPEMLDGRVKTLHPVVHGGILAMRENKDHMRQVDDNNIGLIDIVAVNLYPFKQTIMKKNVILENAIENIDIGGPTLMRAAAKNWSDVIVLCDPNDYAPVVEMLSSGGVNADRRYDLACKIFEHTAAYDALVASYLRKQQETTSLFPSSLTVTYDKVQSMRYGENPHQSAAFYREIYTGAISTIADAVQLHGKELSFNNINDANGALDVIKEFTVTMPCAVAVKHANPCGVGVGETLLDAYTAAYDADPVSIFGGIVAVNREVNAETAKKMSEIFLEIIIAPSFSQEALDILSQKKNIRLLELHALQTENHYGMMDFKKVAGGLLVQNVDTELYDEHELKIATDRKPTKEEMAQLLLAWRVVKHTKSNGIVLFKGNSTVGIGPGQTDRITALKIAVDRAGDRAEGSVLASDAFFPFSDCVDAAKAAGVTAIIQPGGSIRDEDSIKACNDAGIAMVFTGMRHFKH